MIDSTTASERPSPVGCPLVSDSGTTAKPARLRRARPLRPRSGRRDRTALGGRAVRRPRGRRVVLLLDRPADPLAGAARAGVRLERRPPRQAQRAPPGRTRHVSSPRAGSWRTASAAACIRASRAWPRSTTSSTRVPSTSPPASTRSSRPSRAGYTIDWRAWASIFYLRFPIGERTPFQEVKRLRPFSTLEWDADRRERRRPSQHRWPWAEVQPTLGLDEGAERRRRGNAGGGRAPSRRARHLHAQRWLGLPAPALPPGRAVGTTAFRP